MWVWLGVPLVELYFSTLWSSISLEGINRYLWPFSFYLSLFYLYYLVSFMKPSRGPFTCDLLSKLKTFLPIGLSIIMPPKIEVCWLSMTMCCFIETSIILMYFLMKIIRFIKPMATFSFNANQKEEFHDLQ